MMETYKFDGYTLRPAEGAEDYGLAVRWTKADPAHRHLRPSMWLEQSFMVNSYVLEDEQGIVFFFQVRRSGTPEMVEVYIQFPPMTEPAARIRMMSALIRGFAWLDQRLSDSGFAGLYFYSNSHNLIRFCEKRLGFQWDGRRLERMVADGGKIHSKSDGAYETQRHAG